MPSLHKDVKAAVSATYLPPIQTLISDSELIKQGAEAKVYKSTLYPSPTNASSPQPVTVLLKHRFAKAYRHATLDAQLTRQRLTSEARALVRCMKHDVRVPGLRVVDVRQGVLGMEWIEGWSVRQVLGGGQEGDELPDDDDDGEEQELEESEHVEELLRSKGVESDALLLAIGREIAKMHIAEVIHGDLTTSNMMVRLTLPETPNDPPFEVVIIDFGLSSASPMPEERAVDLYVLERAFSSTHPVPRLANGEEGIPHFDMVLQGYERTLREMGKKGEQFWTRTEKRLEEVRLRGRKRSMVGPRRDVARVSVPSSLTETETVLFLYHTTHTLLSYNMSNLDAEPSSFRTGQQGGQVVENMADEFVKSPPNNLGLSDVKDQDPANSLIGARDTEAVRDGQTAEDVKKAEKLAAQIEKERQQQK